MQPELSIVLVAYRATPNELSAKTLEFSRASIEERWAAGRADVRAALDKLERAEASQRAHGYAFYDGRRSTSHEPATALA